MDTRRLIAALALVVTAATLAAAPQQVTEDQARAFAATAATQAKGNERTFERAFRDLVRGVIPGYDAETVTIHYQEGLSIWLAGPLSSFHRAATATIRKMEKLESIEWDKGADIVVYPSRIDAPNIEKIVVTRDGQVIDPISNTLTAVEMESRMGAKVKIGAGIVSYSLETFATGAEVVVTVIPASGRNLSKTLKDSDLKKIR